MRGAVVPLSVVVCKTREIEGPHNNLKTLTVSFKTLTPPTLSPLQEIPANYQFRWDVLDGYTGNDFGQEEARFVRSFVRSFVKPICKSIGIRVSGFDSVKMRATLGKVAAS